MCDSDTQTKDDIDHAVQQYIQSENPFNRVSRLYKINEANTQPYPEAWACRNATFYISTFAGAVMLSFGGHDARANYLAANVATSYKTRWSANRMAMDAYMYGGLRNTIKWIVLVGMAVSSFSHLSQAIELYRVKTSTVNYLVSGALVGGASRVMLGPPGMLGGSLIGGYCGTMIGYLVTRGMTYKGYNIEKRYAEEVRKNMEDTKYYAEISARVAAQLEEADKPETAQQTTNIDNKTASDRNDKGAPAASSQGSDTAVTLKPTEHAV